MQVYAVATAALNFAQKPATESAMKSNIDSVNPG
jgi:hypothetical protein